MPKKVKAGYNRALCLLGIIRHFGKNALHKYKTNLKQKNARKNSTCGFLLLNTQVLKTPLLYWQCRPDITGTVTLPQGVDMVKPGDNTKIIGELIHPIAMDKGLKLAIREGGHTIASGQVTEVLS